MGRKDKNVVNVVAEVQHRTAQAAALEQIPGQRLLADPATNPAVRQHADRLRDEQLRIRLEAEHRRALRRDRVADRRAGHAEQALRVLQDAKDADSPARSVLALHRGRRLYMGLALGASVALGVGSALGVGEFAAELGAPRTIGYVAEIGGVGLTTVTIAYRAHLGRHGGRVTGWQAWALWALIFVPLAASIAANLAGAGPVGVLCSVGAAAFALLGHIAGEASARALREQAAQVTDTDEVRLWAVAMGEDDVPAAGPAAPVLEDAESGGDWPDPWERIEPGGPQPWPAAEDGAGISDAEIAALLGDQDQDPPSGGIAPRTPEPGDDGSDGAARRAPTADHIGAHTVGDQRGDGGRGRGDQRDRIASATAARIAQGDENRKRVADFYAAHPTATVRDAARALGLGEATIKRHRAWLRKQREVSA